MKSEDAPHGGALGAVWPDAHSEDTPIISTVARSNSFQEQSLSPLFDSSPPCEGVDKIAAIVRTREVLLPQEEWKESGHRDAGSNSTKSWMSTTRRLNEWCRIHISVGYIPGKDQVARIEFNPSRVIYPKGHFLASVEDLPNALSQVEEVVAEVVTLAYPLEISTICALHYAFDIPVEDTTVYVRAMSLRPLKANEKPHVYTPGGIPRSAVWGNTHVRSTMYDKHVESNGLAPPGLLRTEVQWKPRGITPAGLRNVAELTPSLVRTAALKRLIGAGVDRPVHVGGIQHLDMALRSEGWTDRRLRSLYGFLVQREVGIDDHLGDRTRQKYNRVMKQHGVALDLEAALKGTADTCTVRHLDFDTHTEVINS